MAMETDIASRCRTQHECDRSSVNCSKETVDYQDCIGYELCRLVLIGHSRLDLDYAPSQAELACQFMRRIDLL